MHHFAVLKLHHADSVERAAFVGDRVFRNPQFARSEKPPNSEARRLVRVMAAEVLQIPFAVYAFTGLRVVADDMLVVDFMLDILISSRGSGPMLAQSGFDLSGRRPLAALVFDLCHFRVLCFESIHKKFSGVCVCYSPSASKRRSQISLIVGYEGTACQSRERGTAPTIAMVAA